MLGVGSNEKIDGFMARFRDLKGALDTGIGLQTSFVSVRMSEKVDMMCACQLSHVGDLVLIFYHRPAARAQTC